MDKTEPIIQLVKNTMEEINAAIRCARRQNYYQFAMEEKHILEQVGEILPLCHCLELDNVIQKVQQALVQIMEAKEARDYILTADYYELLLLPVLSQILELSRQWEIRENYWQLNSQILKEQ